MSKAKMKFPPIQGDTPREKFINLVRHVMVLPKEQIISPDERSIPSAIERKRASHRHPKTRR